MDAGPLPELQGVAFASCSIGRPDQPLRDKLRAIASAGFNGIELSFPDLLAFAKDQRSGSKDVAEDDWPTLCDAAAHIRQLCADLNLHILVLQPFANFEGWPEGSPERDAAFKRARGWIDIMAAAGTNMLQVGSSDSPGIADTPVEDLARDLAELADLLAEKGFRLAYENWCWATRAPRWRDVWDIVQKADRPNIGLCLDTFQTAGGEWGDPTTASGCIEAQGVDTATLTTRYRESLQELAYAVPADKIFFLQISDAYKAEPPLDGKPDDSGLRPRGRWSHDYRPLPYDGGYLPIAQFVEAVLATGFRGWFSMEVFDGHYQDKYGEDVEGYARKAMQMHTRLLEDAVGQKSISGHDTQHARTL